MNITENKTCVCFCKISNTIKNGGTCISSYRTSIRYSESMLDECLLTKDIHLCNLLAYSSIVLHSLLEL